MAKNINLNVGNMAMSFQGVEIARFAETGSGSNADYVEWSTIEDCIYAETLNWLKNPTEDEKSGEIAKIQKLITEWQKDNTLSKVSVRVMYDGILCPASVCIFEKNSCYIYFSDFDDKIFFEIRYVSVDAEPLQYITKKWGRDEVVENSDELPTSKAVANYVNDKIAETSGAYAGALTGGYTGTEEQFYKDLASIQGIADALAEI